MAGSKKEGCILKQSPFSFEELYTDSLNQGHFFFPLKFIKMNSDPSSLIFQISFLFQPLTFMLDQKGKLFPLHFNHLIYHQRMSSHLSKESKSLCMASVCTQHSELLQNLWKYHGSLPQDEGAILTKSLIADEC